MSDALSADTAPRPSGPGEPVRPPETAPALPEPSRWQRFAAAMRFDGVFWRKFGRLGCVYGPEWWKRGGAPVVAAILFALVGRNRRATIANQRRLLAVDAPAADGRRAALRAFRTFADCFVDSMEYYGPRPGRFRIDEPERNTIVEALERGGGVVLVTAHVGNWEISAQALQKTGRPVHMVMAREPNQTTQEYAWRSRARGGIDVILSDSSVFSVFNMLRVLRQNEILAIQLDRGVPGQTGPQGTRDVPFFGSPAPFQEGPFQLARVSGAPVVPVFTLRRGARHYEIVLGEPRYVSRTDPGDLEAALRETVAILEDTIRAHPDQWFQFAPFWD